MEPEREKQRRRFLLRQKLQQLDKEHLGHHVLAALIAAPLFELALCLLVAAWSTQAGGRWVWNPFRLPWQVHAIYCGAAFLVGLTHGFKGLEWTMGHLFRTHHENQRNDGITLAMWGALAVLLLLIYVF
ncbi:MAG: hypothetical protein ACKOWD_13870 [Rhodoferax sp.]